MDKTAQAARQARLAQALRTNLRRRKSGDADTPARPPGGDEVGDAPNEDQAGADQASEPGPAT